MDYKEILVEARKNLGPYCKGCVVCNGLACGNSIPGPGSKLPGNGAARNFKAWEKICVNIDNIAENVTSDISFDLFGKTFTSPIFIAPIGGLWMHYSDKITDIEYNKLLIDAAAAHGSLAFVGDALKTEVLATACDDIGAASGMGVPTIKPWGMDTVFSKLDLAKKNDAFMVSMDIDGAGLTALRSFSEEAGSKTVAQIKELVDYVERPFLLKGVMTAKGALKALEAGCAGIVVSNHGGRVQGQTPATVEVLPEIVEAVGGKMKIFIDGGIRSGVDVFKALALGADGVLIGRPFVSMVYGGGAEAVEFYFNKIEEELRDTMNMCGAKDLNSISRDMISHF